jgi:hypothetical protein
MDLEIQIIFFFLPAHRDFRQAVGQPLCIRLNGGRPTDILTNQAVLPKLLQYHEGCSAEVGVFFESMI